MNVKDYIESGSIESCVLGLADAAEQQEFERMCAAHAEVRAARDAFEASLEASAMQGAVPPPSSVRENFLNTIAGESQKPVAPVVTMNTDTQEKSAPGWTKYMAAASLVLLAGSAALNVYLYNRYKQSDSLYQVLLVSQQELASNNGALQTKVNELEDDLGTIKNPSIQPVKMTAVNNTNSLTTVYWNRESAEVFLMVNNLPKPAAGKQYQLWAIVDGKPVDAGVFDVDPITGLVKMKNIPKAEAFAITLENTGGSASPTMEAMYVLGKV